MDAGQNVAFGYGGGNRDYRAQWGSAEPVPRIAALGAGPPAAGPPAPMVAGLLLQLAMEGTPTGIREAAMADVLAIDDEKEWLELYAEGLSEVGHTVRIFGDGQAALNEIGRSLPDLVVLDIRMAPSGRQMLWMIRRYWPELPVVISSAYGGYRHDPDFDKADAFVDKSTDLNELITTIDSVLSQRQGAQAQPGA